MFSILYIFWFIRYLRSFLFWVFLWQLKDYHIGRFVAHFYTWRGKRIFLNNLLFLKIVLFFGIVIWRYLSFFRKEHFGLQIANLYGVLPSSIAVLLPASFFDLGVWILFFLYLLETIRFLYDLLLGKAKKPVITKKTTLILFCGVVFGILSLIYFTFFVSQFEVCVLALLALDILGPIIFSLFVFLFQPLSVFWKYQLIQKAKRKRQRYKNLLVIGITGSFGKTSTKEILAEILSEKYKVLKTKEHQNSEIGISQCILNELTPEHEIFVCEMGAYNRGGIKLLCDIAKPKIGILTGINEQHMATFGSQENIIKTKYELIESLPIDGLAVFNGSNHYCSSLYEKTVLKKRIYGFQSLIQGRPFDMWAYNVKIEKEFVAFKVHSNDGLVDFKVNLLGGHCILNILGAAIVAKELGIDIYRIAEICRRIKPFPHQMELKRGTNGLNIIDATYSANPDGVISHLDYLKIWSKKKVIVMPCLIELGRASREVHQRIGREIGRVCDLAIITTKDYFNDIKDAALDGGMKEENILFIENPGKILRKIQSFCQPGDVILLESRIPSVVVNNLQSPEQNL